MDNGKLQERLKEHREQLNQALARLHEYQLSNSQLLDKAILSLSSAGLALSLAFIKTIVQTNGTNDEITDTHFLYRSWWMFVLAIVFTLLSFLTSQCGLEKQSQHVLDELESIDDNGTEDARGDEFEDQNGENDPSDLSFDITKLLSWGSVVCYIAAIIFTVLFVKSNVVFTTPN